MYKGPILLPTAKLVVTILAVRHCRSEGVLAGYLLFKFYSLMERSIYILAIVLRILFTIYVAIRLLLNILLLRVYTVQCTHARCYEPSNTVHETLSLLHHFSAFATHFNAHESIKIYRRDVCTPERYPISMTIFVRNPPGDVQTWIFKLIIIWVQFICSGDYRRIGFVTLSNTPY